MSKLSELEDRRVQLIAEVEQIDATKRSIRQQIATAHMEARAGGPPIDPAWLHRAKFKVNKLSSERSALTISISNLKTEIREVRKSVEPEDEEAVGNKVEAPKGDIAIEFMEVAEERLPESKFDEIYDAAMENLRE